MRARGGADAAAAPVTKRDPAIEGEDTRPIART